VLRIGDFQASCRVTSLRAAVVDEVWLNPEWMPQAEQTA
jgi:hypothetical protein